MKVTIKTEDQVMQFDDVDFASVANGVYAVCCGDKSVGIPLSRIISIVEINDSEDASKQSKASNGV